MEENTTVQEQSAANNEVTIEAVEPVKTKAKAKSRAKARTAEQLLEVGPKSMTEYEKIVLINHLKGEINRLEGTVRALEINLDNAYNKVRHFEEAGQKTTEIANQKLNMINDAAKQFATVLNLILYK